MFYLSSSAAGFFSFYLMHPGRQRPFFPTTVITIVSTPLKVKKMPKNFVANAMILAKLLPCLKTTHLNTAAFSVIKENKLPLGKTMGIMGVTVICFYLQFHIHPEIIHQGLQYGSIPAASDFVAENHNVSS